MSIAKYRKPEFPGEWWLTDFTMEQVEGRIANLEKCYAALLTANAAMREALEHCRNALLDYVERLEKDGNAMMGYGRHCIRLADAALAAAPVAPAITHERVRQLCGWYDRLCELLRAGGSDEVAGLSCAIHELRREAGVEVVEDK